MLLIRELYLCEARRGGSLKAFKLFGGIFKLDEVQLQELDKKLKDIEKNEKDLSKDLSKDRSVTGCSAKLRHGRAGERTALCLRHVRT